MQYGTGVNNGNVPQCAGAIVVGAIVVLILLNRGFRGLGVGASIKAGVSG